TTMRPRNAFSFQFQIHEYLRQEKPRSRLLMQEHGVFAEPPQPAMIRPLPLEQRTGIDVRSRPDSRPPVHQEMDELLELFGNEVVVIDACRIGGDTATQFPPPVDIWHARWSIRIAQANNALRLGKRHRRVQTALRLARQIAHVSSISLRQPGGKKWL